MRLNEATELLDNLSLQTTNKTEKKVYSSFTGILISLKEKELTKEQLQQIEEKLTSLHLDMPTENRKKYYSKKLTEFKTFLKNEFSFTTEKYYTAIGMSLGISLGIAIGMPIGIAINPTIGISLGISIGMGMGIALGIAYGAKKDAEAKKQGNVI
ncbi:hypothetical protein [Flavobacterium litorale]|uniref:Glycine zipper family protein n=1 Tax=Flavobacterium litorale TaxID=2856519 RepID=A0ABX8V8N0_9FLAO|nr:hypothetical protein [Flavobacterium litorale]QYJ69166.1 hypothetical protein K1I41_04550 [Flavobacterium litorale]